MHSNAQLTSSELRQALWACAPHFIAIAAFSATINVLVLASPLYMLQIYDRVIVSKSVSTLIGLSLIALAAYLLLGALDAVRGKMLTRTGALFDEMLARRIFDLVATMPFHGARSVGSQQPIRDIDQIRGFLSSIGPTAIFDIPFSPIFLIGCFLLHPWLGVMSACGGIVIIALTVYAEKKNLVPMQEMTRSLSQRHAFAEAVRRNAEVAHALGMQDFLAEPYTRINDNYVEHALRVSEIASTAGAFAKISRMGLQSGIYGLAAFLIIDGEVSAGSMIASSIMMSRALAPIEIAVANWRGFIAARQSYHRLQSTLSLAPKQYRRTNIPAPITSLEMIDVNISVPGSTRLIVKGATLHLKAGQALTLIGPSASGKSTLARALVGVWPRTSGQILLDGTDLEQWNSEALGRHIGYLPQDVELLEGTIAENISRFQPNAPADAIIEAAKIAGAHNFVLSLAKGYNTRIGEDGVLLSGGQRQQIALARAMYGNPFLVILDEPNASLDEAGNAALVRAITKVRKRGGIAIVITHVAAALENVDVLATMEQGRITTAVHRDSTWHARISGPCSGPKDSRSDQQIYLTYTYGRVPIPGLQALVRENSSRGVSLASAATQKEGAPV
jgi:ATP-binding cassette subfamily C protein